MKTVISIFILLIGWAVPAEAQVHPCDEVTPATGVLSSTVPGFLMLCQSPAEKVDAFTVYRGTTPVQLAAPAPVSTTPSLKGLVQYRLPLGLIPVGTHIYTVSAWNKNATGVAQEGPKSSPFTLTVAAPVAPIPAPTAPLIKRVTP